MALRIIFVAVTGTVVQFCPAVSTADKAGKHTCLAGFSRSAFVFPKNLYPFPLCVLNDCRLCSFKYPLIFFRILQSLFEFQGFRIGLEVDGTAGIFPHFDNCPDFPAGVLCVIVVEHIFKNGEIIFSFSAVKEQGIEQLCVIG